MVSPLSYTVSLHTHLHVGIGFYTGCHLKAKAPYWFFGHHWPFIKCDAKAEAAVDRLKS